MKEFLRFTLAMIVTVFFFVLFVYIIMEFPNIKEFIETCTRAFTVLFIFSLLSIPAYIALGGRFTK